MLQHLKAQNRAIEQGIKNIDKYLGKVSEGAHLDENGRCRIQFQEVGLHIVVLPDANMVIFKSFTNFLPDATSGKILPLYYHLLDMSDNPQTGMAYFAIVAAEEVGSDHDMISVETKRPIADMSFEEFEQCARIVGEVANLWMHKLAEDFDAPVVP